MVKIETKKNVVDLSKQKLAVTDVVKKPVVAKVDAKKKEAKPKVEKPKVVAAKTEIVDHSNSGKNDGKNG